MRAQPSENRRSGRCARRGGGECCSFKRAKAGLPAHKKALRCGGAFRLSGREGSGFRLERRAFRERKRLRGVRNELLFFRTGGGGLPSEREQALNPCGSGASGVWKSAALRRKRESYRRRAREVGSAISRSAVRRRNGQRRGPFALKVTCKATFRAPHRGNAAGNGTERGAL